VDFREMVKESRTLGRKLWYRNHQRRI